MFSDYFKFQRKLTMTKLLFYILKKIGTLPFLYRLVFILATTYFLQLTKFKVVFEGSKPESSLSSLRKVQTKN